jgi:hypothetical protein
MLESIPGIFNFKLVLILMDIKRQTNAVSKLCDVNLHRRVILEIPEPYHAYFNIS